MPTLYPGIFASCSTTYTSMKLQWLECHEMRNANVILMLSFSMAVFSKRSKETIEKYRLQLYGDVSLFWTYDNIHVKENTTDE